jgi:hypothetical protein
LQPSVLLFVFLKKLRKKQAEVAHLVEHDLAKVGVAGSSPVFRSKSIHQFRLMDFFYLQGSPRWWTCLPAGRIGRHVPINIGMTCKREEEID